MKAALKKYYHWIIAAAVLLELFIYGGIGNNLNSLFVIPVTEGLQITRTSFSLAFLLRSLTAFISTFFSGIALRRYGYKKCVSVLLITGGLAFFLLSGSKNLPMLCLGAGILGLADGFCSTAGASCIINNWFHRHRGTVFGCVTAATGLGGSVICIVLTGIMDGSGWEAAYLCCGILLLGLSVAIWLLIKDRPENMGLKPYGEGELHKVKEKKQSNFWEGYSLQELYRKPFFYMLLIGTVMSCFFVYMPFTTVVPHLQDCGLTLQQATSMQSVMLLVLAASKLLMGILCDKIGAKLVTILCFVCGILSMVCMAMANSLVLAAVGVVILAVALTTTALTIPLLTTELLGYKGQTVCVGICIAMVSVGSMLHGPVVQSTFDTFGTYRPAYWAAAIGLVFVIFMYLLMYWLADRDKKKNFAAQK